jgi:hypothetical protein
MNHYVITRFAEGVSTQSTLTSVQGKPSALEWLKHRFELFETYTLPGMAKQTVPYHWLLTIDRLLPQWAKSRVASLLQGVRHTLIPCDGRDKFPHLDFVASQSPNGQVITTRLDSDDSLHPEYLAKVQEIAQVFTGVIDLARGVVVSHEGQLGKWITKRGRPFLSLVEESRPLCGVFCAHHNRLAKRIGKVQVVKNGPPWLAVSHRYNRHRSWRRAGFRIPWQELRKEVQ